MIVEAADWTKFEDVKKTFNSADSVGTCVVFNVVGNRARLIAFINYDYRKVVILKIISHEEYDTDRWKNECSCD